MWPIHSGCALFGVGVQRNDGKHLFPVLRGGGGGPYPKRHTRHVGGSEQNFGAVGGGGSALGLTQRSGTELWGWFVGDEIARLRKSLGPTFYFFRSPSWVFPWIRVGPPFDSKGKQQEACFGVPRWFRGKPDVVQEYAGSSFLGCNGVEFEFGRLVDMFLLGIYVYQRLFSGVVCQGRNCGLPCWLKSTNQQTNRMCPFWHTFGFLVGCPNQKSTDIFGRGQRAGF